MSIASVSTKNALHVWADLEQAYFGVNSYGGHVAEIYAYRLIGRRPGRGHSAEWDKEEDLEAASALYDLLLEFKKHRNCTIRFVDYEKPKALGPWLKREEFGHRAHIEIKPKASNHDWKVYRSRIHEAVRAVSV